MGNSFWQVKEAQCDWGRVDKGKRPTARFANVQIYRDLSKGYTYSPNMGLEHVVLRTRVRA